MEHKNGVQIKDLCLGLALLSGNMAMTLLCMVILLTTKKMLSGWVEMVCMFASGVLSLGLMTLYFCLESPEQERGGWKIRRYWADVLGMELWMLSAAGLCRLAAEIWEQEREHFSSSAGWDVAVSAALVLAAALAVSLLFRKMLQKCGYRETGKPFVRGLCLFGILFLSMLVLWAATELWALFFGRMEPSVAGMLAFHLFLAYCEYGVVKLMLAAARWRKKAEDAGKVHGENSAEAVKESLNEAAEEAEGKTLPRAETQPEEKPQEEAGTEGKPVSWKRRAAGMGIPFVLTVALAVWQNVPALSSSSVEEKVKAAVEAAMGEAYTALEEGNLEKAIQELARAEARAKAFESLVSEETEVSLDDIYREYPDDVVVGALYLSDGNALEKAEEKVRNSTLGSEWYPVLLRYYADMGLLESSGNEDDSERDDFDAQELSPEQELLRKELLWWCIGTEAFTGKDVLFAQDLEGKKYAVLRQLKEYEEEFAAGKILQLVVRYGAEGGYTKELAYEALELAEKEPDNLLLQYAAWQAGSHFQEDKAEHYERTVEAAERFDLLYDNGTRTVEQLAAEKRLLGDAALRCYAYDTALEFYEVSYELSEEVSVALACAEILEKQADYAECARMASQILAAEPENTRALYLAAISFLKAGDVDNALDAAGKLGDLLADGSREADPAAENNFYVCVQYMAMTDSTLWTEYRWKIYDSLSEEQIQKVQSHALLWDYMTAVYQCFMKKDYKAAEEAAESILAVRGDLAMAWYLRGTVAFGQKDFEKALEFFRKAENCGGMAPALYFSIANTYDAMEDYENAWIYARRVEEMLPYQDHGNDVYGISYHNRNLLNLLESVLGR